MFEIREWSVCDAMQFQNLFKICTLSPVCVKKSDCEKNRIRSGPKENFVARNEAIWILWSNRRNKIHLRLRRSSEVFSYNVRSASSPEPLFVPPSRLPSHQINQSTLVICCQTGFLSQVVPIYGLPTLYEKLKTAFCQSQYWAAPWPCQITDIWAKVNILSSNKSIFFVFLYKLLLN